MCARAVMATTAAPSPAPPPPASPGTRPGRRARARRGRAARARSSPGSRRARRRRDRRMTTTWSSDVMCPVCMKLGCPDTQRSVGVRNAPSMSAVTAAGRRPSSPSLNAPRTFSGSASASAMPSPAPRSFVSMNATATTRGCRPTLWNAWSVRLGPPWQPTQPALPTNSAAPRCSARPSAAASPSSHASNRPGPQRSWRT